MNNVRILTMLLLVLSFLTNGPAAASADSTAFWMPPTPPPPPELIKIVLSPASGAPGASITATRVQGQSSLGMAWTVQLEFEGVGGRYLSLSPTWASETQLKFLIPQGTSCGSYHVLLILFSPRSEILASSIAVPFVVNMPCQSVPKISYTSLGGTRGTPDEVVTIFGSGFQPGATVLLAIENPGLLRSVVIPAVDVQADQLKFTLPSIETADRFCGNTSITVKNPGMQQGSNGVALDFACPKNTLNVVTYNIHMFPQAVGWTCLPFCVDQDHRAPAIPNRQDLLYHDAIILEEAFSDSHRDIVVNGLKELYPYHTRVVEGSNPLKQDGGVIILSKWPISNGDGQGQQMLFGGACNGTLGDDNDCLAEKGLIYARILKEGKPYHIFGTHLDSGRSDDDILARHQELEMINDFIQAQNIPEDEGVVFGGDFNIDPAAQTSDYEFMLNTLNFSPSPWDGIVDSEGRYTTIIDGDQLDYFLYSNRNLRPRSSVNVVLENLNLSDHNPVVGRFIFGAAAEGPQLFVVPHFTTPGGQVVMRAWDFKPGGYPGTLFWDGSPIAETWIGPWSASSPAFITMKIPNNANLGIHKVTLCAGSPCRTGELEQSASAFLRVDASLASLPLELQRRAQQFVEEQRGSPQAPKWADAVVAPDVRPLYRPDIDGPAYYEFRLQIVESDPDGARITPTGFVILSTGAHDYPVAHWAADGSSPTQELETLAGNNNLISRFYKLDTLAYAAEDASGNLAAKTGPELFKISGQNASWVNQPDAIAETRWSPDTPADDDANAAISTGRQFRSGPTPPPDLRVEAWASWSELKAGYASSYQIMMASLKERASQEWKIETWSREYGEGLRKGQVYDIALLESGSPKVTVSGPGAALVKTEVIPQSSRSSTLRITVLDSAPDQSIAFDVSVQYASSAAETLHFAVVEPVKVSVYLPLVSGGSAGPKVMSVPSAAALSSSSDWGPWTTVLAGSDDDQRRYGQIAVSVPPNRSGCPSGCGATAWAMLFGWADHQAAKGSSYWAHRWGIYRQNGGYGLDADAPKTMDQGVRNMTWEIREDAGTFCITGQGATWPWEMSDAAEYLQGRSFTRVTTHYNIFGISSDHLRDYAVSSIRDRGTPAVIGTGWLRHYPLAYGYRSREREVRACPVCWWTHTDENWEFLVNEGWPGNPDNLSWVPANTWFVGEVTP